MSRRLIIVLAVFSLAFICPAATVSDLFATRVTIQPTVSVLIPVTGEEQFSGCGGALIPPVNADYEQSIVYLTNQVRRQHNLPPLKRITALDDAARYHAADMAQNNYFNHNSFHTVNGKMVQVCDPWNRIQNYYTGWEALAENIAAGQDSPSMAMNGWINSPEHLHNILNPEYWEIGAGYYQGNTSYTYYWDQDFGRRIGVYPLILNDEAASTASAKVDVYIYGDWKQVRLKNDDGSWGKWLEFKNEFQWTLPSAPGQHTLSAQMRASGGKSASASDTIGLTPHPHPKPHMAGGGTQDKGCSHQPYTSGGGSHVHGFGSACITRQCGTGARDHQDQAHQDVIPEVSRYRPKAGRE